MQISRCLDPGMTLIVGTANAQNVPVSCRAVALASQDDVTTVTVCLLLHPAERDHRRRAAGARR
jgi:hypothetical protein